MDLEKRAIQICEEAQNQLYQYGGHDKSMKGKTGRFEILEDMNCCAPTQNVLFSFQSAVSRKVMDAAELVSFFQECRSLQ